MHVVHYSSQIIENELKSMDLDNLKIEQFLQSCIRNVFKLCDIPGSLVPLLEELVSRENAAIIFSEKTHAADNDIDAVIAGSSQEISSLCRCLKAQSGKAGELGQSIHHVLEKLKHKPTEKLHLGSHTFYLGKRTLIMGILNITPDSFSDGGRFDKTENAIAQAYKMAADGADIIDIGGESTRPGAQEITAEEELKRVMPVIQALKSDNNFKIPLSIDTYKASVAEHALEAGVEMLNDVWGLKKDSEIGSVAARYRVPVCLMHNRGNTDYDDLIPNIIAELEESIDLARQVGIEDNQTIIDPGIGFGKNLEQNLEVMFHLQVFSKLGYPLLLGTSRKSMIGKTLDLPTEERLEGTAATVAYGIATGADIIRVHDVMQMKRVAVMTDAITRR